MATKPSTIAAILESLGPSVTAKAMFGEYGLYYDGVIIGSVCDDRLFLKQTKAARDLLESVEEAPPYKGAKPGFLLDESDWTDAVRIRKVVAATVQELKDLQSVRSKKNTRKRS